MAKVNDEFQGVIFPVFICFILCNIVGFFGNTVVVYVFSVRYPKNHFRLLVLALSIVDLTSCCTTVPMETISTWLWFDAPSSILCKANQFFVQFTGLSAMYMLFVMAVYKYRLICKPFGKQLTQRILVVVCVLGILNSLVFATPAAFFWDVNNYTNIVDNYTEETFICEVHREFLDTAYPRIYRHLLSAYNVFLLATIVMYVFVAKRTVNHIRQMGKLRKTPFIIYDPKLSKEVSIQESEATAYVNDDTKLGVGSTVVTEHTESDFKVKRKRSAVKPNATMSSGSSQISSVQIRKVVIMVILSGTFAITFLLGQIFGYTFAIRGFSEYSSLWELRLLFTCYRLYFVNYAINPIVYFALDRNFRKEAFAIAQCYRRTQRAV